ncbi:Uncharacterised protein [Mycobacteroides abscessus subsp. abscessus]|nr:Uncharacterised protein [Mycobacteroides abscessus subsp. abscessus]
MPMTCIRTSTCPGPGSRRGTCRQASADSSRDRGISSAKSASGSVSGAAVSSASIRSPSGLVTTGTQRAPPRSSTSSELS